MPYKITIIGGGYLGLSIAQMLANEKLEITLVERRDFSCQPSRSEPARLLAIASQTIEIYKNNGMLCDLNDIGQAITFIRTQDNESPMVLDFDPVEIGMQNFGYMINEFDLARSLYKKVQSNQFIKVKAGVDCQDICLEGGKISTQLQDGTIILSDLVIAADGKNSFAKKLFGIESHVHDYKQFAIIFDIEHNIEHQGCAFEKFMPNGPFAVLPQKNGYCSSVVWTVSAEKWPFLKGLAEDDFKAIVQAHIMDFYTEFSITSEIKAFPLHNVTAKSYFATRVALLGDALHSIHPMAGQGLNLSMRDAKILQQLIHEYVDLGLDIGSVILLEEYQKKRRVDNALMSESMIYLDLLFSNQSGALKHLRRMGLGIVNKVSPLKHAFMRYATGKR
jgi:2-octaprenyl-6-methoxyphenol hydroxylase